MRLFLIFYFVLCGSNLFSQPKVRHYDYFDFESSYDDYANIYSRFQEEDIKGNVKELRRISSRIDLHLRLNNKGEIVESLEYVDSSRHSRVKIYANRKIIKETEFNSDNTKAYTFYEYNESGKLISKAYLRDERNRRSSVTIKYVYNDKGQLILGNFGGKREEKFIYEGDSIEWKLINNNDKLLINVARRFKKIGYELVTRYKLDTLSDAGFKERIFPNSEFERRWDNNGNTIEMAEYSYDSSGNRIQTGASKFEYDDKHLIKSSFVYNTDQLKGESSDEYIYDNNGLLQSTIYKHGNRIDKIDYKYDQQGNIIHQMGFTFRYSYDSNGNWILKESFHKEKSSSTRIRNGVTTTQKFKDDTWLTEEKREILYF
jgi:hypothetical protein